MGKIIVTDDKDLIAELFNNDFYFLYKIDGYCYFLNDEVKQINFSNKRFQYTDKLNI